MKYTILIALFGYVAHAAEPIFSIQSADKNKTWSATELLKMAKPVDVGTDVTYQKALTTFQAIPVYELLEGFQFKDRDMLQFHCADQFSAPLDKNLVLSKDPKKAIAYLAVEDPKKPWPIIPKKKTSAGPFYLIWKNAEASKIGSEQWPFQVISFSVKGSLRETYPLIHPKENASQEAKKGFQVFTKNCFACHKMNGQGLAAMGPDLNIPMNPTEYWQKKAFPQLVRDPHKVRTWPALQMNVHFTAKDISDQEMEQLWGYLEHMVKQKAK